MSEDITQKLTNMKTQIEAAERESAQVQGRIDSLMDRLKNEFGFSTLGEAQAALEKMDKELTEKENKLAQDVTDLEGAYDWGKI